MQVSRSSARETSRIAIVGALLCSILAVGSVGLGEARATATVRCSTVAGVGTIDDEDAFNAAVTSVNDGDCNEIDIAGSFAFTDVPAIVLNPLNTTLVISGPSVPVTLSGKKIVGSGATYVRGLSIRIDEIADIEIRNLILEDFRAGENHGGALNIATSSSSTVSLHDVEFSQNRAQQGGAVALSGIVDIHDSTFTNNMGVSALATVHGGAISHGAGGSLLLDTVQFVGNSVSVGGRGGAVRSASPVDVMNSTFTGNSAARGGALYLDGLSSSPQDIGLSLLSSNFNGNTATISGGAIDVEDGEITIDGGEFSANTAGIAGGAINAELGEIANADFSENEVTGVGTSADAEGTGGAIAVRDSVTIEESMFTLNSAPWRGGAVSAGDGYLSGSEIVATRSTFSYNSVVNSSGQGGALAAETVRLIGGTLSNNTATVLGGAVFATDLVESAGVVFSDNRAVGPAENYASKSGGSIYADHVIASDSVFVRNKAGSGGAVSAEVRATILISTFRENQAVDGYGGALSAPDVEVRQSSLIENSANWGGGAISVGNAAVVENSTLWRNAAGWGGSLMVDSASSSTSTVRFSTLVGPTTPSVWGSVIAVGLSTTKIGLIGSVLVGSSPVCSIQDSEPSANLAPYSQWSYVSDDSCGGSAGATTINSSYSTLSALGLSATLSTDVGAGRQVLALTSDSALHSSVPLSLLPSGVTTDQLGLARFSSNGLTAAGALRGYTYVAPPAVPEVVPEIPVETVKPNVPIVPAVAVRSVMDDGREVIRGSSPANIGRKVKVMARLRGTKRFVPAGTKVVNKLGRFKWSPVTGKEAEVYFVVGGVASDPVMLAKPRKP